MDNSQSHDRYPPDSSPESMTADELAARYRELYPRLWLTAAGVVGDRIHAEDIVQEASLVALKKLDQFTVGTNLNAWLGEIVRRCAFNYVRKMRNRGTVVADPATLDQQRAREQRDIQPTSLAQLTSSDQMSFDDDVMRALDSIGELARSCLLLRSVQNLTYAEIAELMDIPEGTAMSHVHRAKRRMRELLSQRGPR